jgi:hypothetical protein
MGRVCGRGDMATADRFSTTKDTEDTEGDTDQDTKIAETRDQSDCI